MKKALSFLFVSLLPVVFAPSGVLAVPVDCSGITTLQQHIDANGTGNGCIHDTKIYNDFTYTPGGTNTASNVNVTHQTLHLGGQDTHILVFAPAENPWTADFTLGFSVTVDPTNPALAGHFIVSGVDQLNSDTSTGDGQQVTSTKRDGSFAGPLLDTLTTFATNGGPCGNPGCGDSGTWPGVKSVFNFSTSSGLGSGDQMQSLEIDLTQSIIPEPGTLLLLGGGSAVLGLMRRRRQSGPKS